MKSEVTDRGVWHLKQIKHDRVRRVAYIAFVLLEVGVVLQLHVA